MCKIILYILTYINNSLYPPLIILPMQCVEHVVAQRIAILRVQKPDFALFLPSENRFSRPSLACVLVPANIAVLTKMCKRPIRDHYRFV